MRIYQDCLEMVKEVERDLFEMGIRYQTGTVQDKRVADDPKFMTIELNGYAYKLTNAVQIDEMLDYMGINRDWVADEFHERIDSYLVNPGTAFKYPGSIWEQYLHDGEFEYTYNERIREQIDYLFREMFKFPYTRQGIVTIYDQHKDMRNWGGKARVPCSLSFQFLMRNDSVHLIYSMRSCDFLKHFASDVALAIMFQSFVAHKLEKQVGTFTHFLGSLHAFQGDMERRGIF